MSSSPLVHDFDLSIFSPLNPEQIFHLVTFLQDERLRTAYEFDDGAGTELLGPPRGPLRDWSPSPLRGDAIDRLRFFLASNCPVSPEVPVTSLVEILKRLAAIDWTPRGKYSLWVQLFPDRWWTFMNYGLRDPQIAEALPPLTPVERDWQLAVQMYHKVATLSDVTQRDVLEVGSGRGGGAAYVARHLGPKTVVGMDATQSNVIFSRETHDIPGLRYTHGFAEALPFAEDSFDVVLNVESCNYYSPFNSFLSEVRRVLRNGGMFLLAFFARPPVLIEMRDQIQRAGFVPTYQEDVSSLTRQAITEFLRHDCGEILARNRTALKRDLYNQLMERIYWMPSLLNHRLCYLVFAFRNSK